jgi:hypothetical protein
MTQEDLNPVDLEEHMVEAYTNLNDQEVLDYTKRLKIRMVQVLAPGERMPTDAKEVNTLLNVLDSLDSSAHNNIKAQKESDNNAAQREALAIIAQMQKQARGNDPFMLTDNNTTTTRTVVIEETLVTNEFDPGELSHEMRELNYDDFVNTFEDKK